MGRKNATPAFPACSLRADYDLEQFIITHAFEFLVVPSRTVLVYLGTLWQEPDVCRPHHRPIAIAGSVWRSNHARQKSSLEQKIIWNFWKTFKSGALYVIAVPQCLIVKGTSGWDGVCSARFSLRRCIFCCIFYFISRCCYVLNRDDKVFIWKACQGVTKQMQSPLSRGKALPLPLTTG